MKKIEEKKLRHLHGIDHIEIGKMQRRELDVSLEKMNYKEPVPLSKQEKREAMLLGAIVALTYLFALGCYLS